MKETGRLCSAPPKEIIEQVWQNIYEEQSTSTRQRSQELGITPSTLWQVQRDIQMFSYKFQLVQELKPRNHQAHFHLNDFIQMCLYKIPDFRELKIPPNQSHSLVHNNIRKSAWFLFQG